MERRVICSPAKMQPTTKARVLVVVAADCLGFHSILPGVFHHHHHRHCKVELVLALLLAVLVAAVRELEQEEAAQQELLQVAWVVPHW